MLRRPPTKRLIPAYDVVATASSAASRIRPARSAAGRPAVAHPAREPKNRQIEGTMSIQMLAIVNKAIFKDEIEGREYGLGRNQRLA